MPLMLYSKLKRKEKVKNEESCAKCQCKHPLYAYIFHETHFVFGKHDELDLPYLIMFLVAWHIYEECFLYNKN